MKINKEDVIGIGISEKPSYFHFSGCDNCGNNLACDVMDVNVHTTKTKWTDYYIIQLCHNCINSYYNGDPLEDTCKNLLKI
jgi:hypothetical protein